MAFNLARRIINGIRRPAGEGRPPVGRALHPRAEDTVRDYPSSNLTPARLMGILRQADMGDISAAMQLYEEMEEKDAHLYSVANTRRLAVTGLEWSVVGEPSHGERSLAEETAAYCREVLAGMESFDGVLQHLSLATGRNIAVAELVWGVREGALALEDVVPVDFQRVVLDELDQPRVLTDDAPREGAALLANKFVVHAPQCATGHPMRGGLLRVTALIYLAKNLALKDWLVFAEVFGMPVRIARYEPSASAEEKREMLRMLETLGSNAAGIFSRAVDLQIVEAGRGGARSPYSALVEFLNREMSKAWLGQTLTTDITGARGTSAASTVHAQVRQDVLADDLRKEARTIRRDILSPMVRLRFGVDAPVPRFRRKVRRAQTAGELAELLVTATGELGLRVPEEWVHESLGLPRADENERIVSARGGLGVESVTV